MNLFLSNLQGHRLKPGYISRALKMLIPADSEISRLGLYPRDEIQNYEQNLLCKYVLPSSEKSNNLNIHWL